MTTDFSFNELTVYNIYVCIVLSKHHRYQIMEIFNFLVGEYLILTNTKQIKILFKFWKLFDTIDNDLYIF